jgi:hypothetical protein
VLVDLVHPGPDLGKEVLGDKRNRVLGDLGVELLSRPLQAVQLFSEFSNPGRHVARGDGHAVTYTQEASPKGPRASTVAPI